MPRIRGIVLQAAVAALLSANASAQSQGLGQGQLADPAERSTQSALWVAHGESDNIGRSDAGIRGSYNAIGVVVDARRERQRLSAGINTDLQYREYSQDELESEQIGDLELFANVAIVPQRFLWNFNDNFSQGRTDAFAAVGPENRQNINLFSTGPELDLELGNRMTLSVDGTYTERKHEETDQLDAQSRAYELGLFRQTATTSRWGVVLDTNNVDYNNGPLSYEIVGAAVRYERRLATGEVLAELGRNELRIGDSRESGPRAQLGWRRGLGGRSRLGINATKEFTDSDAMFSLTTSRPLVTVPGEAILAADAMEQARVEILYELDAAKTDLAIGVSKNQDRFQLDDSFNNDNTTVRWEVQRMLGTRTTLTFGAEKISRSFIGIDGTQGDRLTQASLERRLGRRITCEANVTQYERRAADVFDERRYELRLNYRPAS